MSIPTKSLSLITASVVALGAMVSTAQAGPGGAARMIERMDTDASGTISLAEYTEARSARLERKFDRRDKNDDGSITEDEVGRRNANSSELRECIQASLGESGKPTWEERLAEVDTDFDGAIDLGEFTTAAIAKAQENFASIDSDASGDITEAEIAAARETRKAERQQKRAEKRAAKTACAEQLGIELPVKRNRQQRNG